LEHATTSVLSSLKSLPAVMAAFIWDSILRMLGLVAYESIIRGRRRVWCPLCASSPTVSVLTDDHAILADLGVTVLL
jgi:formate dehydrogenase maturation protein FdhE